MLNPFNAPELSAQELADTLESGRPIQVVDVRAPMHVGTGRIEIVPDERFHNIVGSQLITYHSLEGTGIDPQVPVAVVCGHGNDSRVLALHLSRLGCDARSLSGGTAAWMTLTLPRELESPASLDRLLQFDRVGKGALGYLLISAGEALILDPPRDYSAYELAAKEAGAEIVGVADTHVHADYISGAPMIAADFGVPYYLHPADAVYPYDGTPGLLEFQALSDGQAISVGRANLRAKHTPGHTEGHVSFVLDDAVAFTGDFIFVGSIGRPDLGGKVREWAVQLWASLETGRREWPAEMMIYPAHYGLESERRDDRSVGGEFGTLLGENASLRFSDQESFVGWVESNAASFPDAYRMIKAVNVGLLEVGKREAEALEVGKNECALGVASGLRLSAAFRGHAS
jgi:glyoxylase-like metal-dependent hydrolase (beta-lactamase superfamily II)